MSTEEDHVAVIERDGLRLGTATDAGRLCVTERSPRGVSGDLFRYYGREQDAPGPYKVRDPITRELVSARDSRGRELFDLDAVEKWNASRPGMGARTVRPGQRVRWSPLRRDLLVGARDGRLRLQQDRPWLGDDELGGNAKQRVGELVEAGLLRRPRGKNGGKYTLTPAGSEWLAEHVPTPARTG
jgi:hypothetical protein